MINRNNFFVKFAHLYITNITGMKEQITDMRDAIIDSLEYLVVIFITPISLLISLISTVFPLKQILVSFNAEYLNKEDLKKLYLHDKEPGYYSKRQIKQRKAKIAEELKSEQGGEIEEAVC